MRDSERTQVYAAEDLSAENTVLVALQPLAALQSVVVELLGSRWWRRGCGATPQAIDVAVNRSMQRSLWLPSRRRISLSPLSMDLNTLCHELAHAAAEDFGVPAEAAPVHGRNFREMHVGVRHGVMGRRCGDDLAEVYRQFGLGISVSNDRETAAWTDSVFAAEQYAADAILEIGRKPNFQPVTKTRGPIAL